MSGKWSGKINTGDWYDGVIVSIDNKTQTVFVKYDDGDHDKSLSWHDVANVVACF